MAVTEVTKTSYGQRVGSSFRGIGSGILLLIVGTVLLWWNEGRTVRTAGAIKEAEMVTVDLPSIDTVDNSFNGKVIYTTGKATTTDTLTDSEFNVEVKNALKLKREVQYYQWVEKSHKETRERVGGEKETITTYTYHKEWVKTPISSASFKESFGHQNTVSRRVEETTQYAKVNLGAYTLPQNFVGAISGRNLLKSDYIGFSESNPQIGDVKIEFYYTPETDISLIAQVQGDSFKKYKASNGEDFYALSTGVETKAEMFKGEKTANAVMAWVLRLVGLLMAVGGFKAVLAPLATLFVVIPALGHLAGAGTGFVAWILGSAWAFIVIAIAWLRFRPILSISLLAIAAVLIIIAFVRKGKKKPELSLN